MKARDEVDEIRWSGLQSSKAVSLMKNIRCSRRLLGLYDLKQRNKCT